MEKEIFKSKYIQILYDHKTRIYKSIYLPETQNMTDQEWKKLMIDIVKIIEHYKPKFIIDDNRDRRYDYSPDMQAWTLELFVSSWNNIKLEKYVQILPKHIIGKITSEQIQELSNSEFSAQFENKLVADYESAMLWLMETNNN